MTNDFACALNEPRRPYLTHIGDQWYARVAHDQVRAEADVADFDRASWALVAEMQADLLAGVFLDAAWVARVPLISVGKVGNITTEWAQLLCGAGQDLSESAGWERDHGARCLARVLDALDALHSGDLSIFDPLERAVTDLCRLCVVRALVNICMTLCEVGIGPDRVNALAGVPRDHVWS